MPFQIIVMTSDKSQNLVLPGFAYLFNKYWSHEQPVTICGFTNPKIGLPKNFIFESIGEFKEFPANRWSDAFKRVLDNIAEEHFLLLLDDYWLVRDVDIRGMKILFDYAKQFKNVIKMDVTRDRLYADPGKYSYDFNTYGSAGHLDLIQSDTGKPYHMSLWGGIWSRENLYRVLIPGETAQQIELEGTPRLSSFGNELLVLGTRQGPLIHGNILQSSKNYPVYSDGGWAIAPPVLSEMREQGILNALQKQFEVVL